LTGIEAEPQHQAPEINARSTNRELPVSTGKALDPIKHDGALATTRGKKRPAKVLV
jgi:hypothetical protein